MKFRKVLLFLGAFLLLLILAVLIAIPYIAKNYINNNGQELIGRNLQLEEVSINYLSSSLSLEKLFIAEENETDTFLYLESFFVNLDLIDILNEKYTIEQLQLEGLNCNLSVIDTTFNFNSIIEHFASEESDTNEVIDSSAIFYEVQELKIGNSRISYWDRNTDAKITLQSLGIEIPGGFGSEKTEFDIITAFELASGGAVDAELILNLEKESYQSSLDINALELGVLKAYVKDFMYVGKLGAQLSTKLQLAGSFMEPSDINIAGAIDLDQVVLSDTNQVDVFGLKKLHLKIDSLNPAKDVYQLSIIDIHHPMAHFEYYAKTDNFSNMLIASDSTEVLLEEDEFVNPFILIGDYVSEALEGIKASNFGIDTVLVNELELQYVDHTLLQTFEYQLSNTNLSAYGVRSDADSLKVKLDLLLNGEGEVEGNAILHPKKPKDVTFYLKAKQIALKDFTPYFHYYLGLPILKGRYDMESSLSIKDLYLLSHNNVLAKAFTLGKKQKHDLAYNLPVKVGVAMLKDRKGDINLDIPIEGNLADPKYKVGKMILGILKELLVKAASGPYKLIANSLQTDEESSKQVNMAHLYDKLTDREYRRLDNIAKVLKEKPSLTLLLSPYYNESIQLEYWVEVHEKASYLEIDYDHYLSEEQQQKVNEVQLDDSLFIAHLDKRLATEKMQLKPKEKLISLIKAEEMKKSIEENIKFILTQMHAYLLSQGVGEAQLQSLIATDVLLHKESGNKNIQFHILFDAADEED